MITLVQNKKTMKAIYQMALALFAAVLLSLPLFLTSCKKTTPDKPNTPVTPPTCDTCLPDITTSGKGTFGCKVNGKIWLTKGGWLSPATTLGYFNQELTVVGYNSDYEQRVNISLKPLIDSGFYAFETTNFSTSRVLYRMDENNLFTKEPVSKGYIYIKRFDLLTGVISGTFAFDAYNSRGDTVHITEGRFDLRF